MQPLEFAPRPADQSSSGWDASASWSGLSAQCADDPPSPRKPWCRIFRGDRAPKRLANFRMQGVFWHAPRAKCTARINFFCEPTRPTAENSNGVRIRRRLNKQPAPHHLKNAEPQLVCLKGHDDIGVGDQIGKVHTSCP